MRVRYYYINDAPRYALWRYSRRVRRRAAAAARAADIRRGCAQLRACRRAAFYVSRCLRESQILLYYYYYFIGFACCRCCWMDGYIMLLLRLRHARCACSRRCCLKVSARQLRQLRRQRQRQRLRRQRLPPPPPPSSRCQRHVALFAPAPAPAARHRQNRITPDHAIPRHAVFRSKHEDDYFIIAPPPPAKSRRACASARRAAQPRAYAMPINGAPRASRAARAALRHSPADAVICYYFSYYYCFMRRRRQHRFERARRRAAPIIITLLLL